MDEQFVIYPNPANSVLFIKSENGLGNSKIVITDILGKTIIEKEISDLYQTSINIDELTSGVYLLQIKNDKGFVTKKFIKQ